MGQKEGREEQGNMELTWNDEDVTEEAQEELTPWEKFLEKKRDKKKKRDQKKKKGKKDDLHEDDEDDIPEGIDMSDPFFAEELGEDYVKSKKVKNKKKEKKEKYPDANDNPEDSKELSLMVM